MDLDDEELKATRRMNGSDKNVACMEEDIKLVGNLIKEYRLYGDLDGIAINDMSVYINAIEHLIEAYKELEEENEIIKGNYYTLCADIQMVTSELGFPEDTIIADEMVAMIKENYIPKSKIKETIEEFKLKIEKYYEHKIQGKETDVELYENITNIEIVRVLQELLEGK